MNKRKMFWQFFGTHILILTATVAFTGLYTWDISNVSFKRQWVRELETQALLAAALLPVGDGLLHKEEVSSFFERVGKAGIERRFTLILPDGKVLGDTDADSSQMTSHIDRPEVIAAMKEGQGMGQRYSSTLHKSMLYLALRVPREGPMQAVIRVAVPLRTMMRETGAAGHVMIVLLLVVLGATLAVSYGATQRIIGPVSDLQNGLAKIGDGDHDYRLPIPSVPHLADLARSINETIDRLQKDTQAMNEDHAPK